MGINVDDEGSARKVSDTIEKSLALYQAGFKINVWRALTLLEASIQQNIRNTFTMRTGNLLNSISTGKTVEQSGDTIIGSIGPVGVKYAAIHEFGGITPPHIILPRVAKVLRFQMGRQEVFARYVNHPGSKIPARPYLRPALERNREKIKEKFGLFLLSAFKNKGA